jgi:hypothetical protein
VCESIRSPAPCGKRKRGNIGQTLSLGDTIPGDPPEVRDEPFLDHTYWALTIQCLRPTQLQVIRGCKPAEVLVDLHGSVDRAEGEGDPGHLRKGNISKGRTICGRTPQTLGFGRTGKECFQKTQCLQRVKAKPLHRKKRPRRALLSLSRVLAGGGKQPFGV